MKKSIKTKFTALTSDAWIDVTETPASSDVVVISDIILSSDQSASKCQLRQYNGSANELVAVFNTASDRNEVCNFQEPIHLKQGYRLQCSASANSFATINYYTI